MAWLLSAPQFLFFALLSPLVAVAGWASDRIAGRRTHRRAVADHALARALADSQLAAAVGADLADRDDDLPDPARLAAAARRRCSPLWSRSGGSGGLTVRLGTGTGPTGVTRVDPDGSTTAAVTEHVPVPRRWPRPGAWASWVLVHLPWASRARCSASSPPSPPAQLDVVLVCSRERVAEWAWTTWLPHLTAVALPGDGVPARLLDAAGTAGAAPCTLVVLDGPVEPPVAEALARGADRLVRLDLGDSEAALALPAAARLEVTGETGTSGRLRAPGSGEERVLVPDAVSAATAAGIARDLAGLAAAAVGRRAAGQRPAARPARHRPRPRPSGGEVEGSWVRRRDRLLAVLGRTGPEAPRHRPVPGGSARAGRRAPPGRGSPSCSRR